MASEQGTERKLFARNRSATSNLMKARGFLSLPGELRNRIYDYYFEEDFRIEVAAKGTRLMYRVPKFMKLCLGIVNKATVYMHQERLQETTPRTLRMPRRLGRYKRIDGIVTDWSTSLCALVLVCKKVYYEAILFLYQNPTFVFAAPRRILNFLEFVQEDALGFIKKLQLHYNTYGSPFQAKDDTWASKHLCTWTTACKAASKKLVNLQKLEIWLKVNENPLCFDLRREWLKPLLQFRRLGNHKKAVADKETFPAREIHNHKRLRDVKVHFRTYWTGPQHFPQISELADASSDLHHLFAEAIVLAILGSSEEEAMSGFKKAWEGKYSRWRHHLNYSATGW
ncbi:hypothetical protein CC78DRAFT_581326 [Lojkania enalia]|uniref:DUF7730 domain-containing protein n=1 Tax=Lojkania enalia TaxID=147567 RepID=A0A9P4MZE6_9PLEO|nr:hypothetical protein CC78DRAFT_581326 [Didymosphaeria enalia]